MFSFVDLFAGIGGFHAALAEFGGRCVFASEWDKSAAAVYERNWGEHIKTRRRRPRVEGDIVELTDPDVLVPNHDLLAAGFPCQPFSKSGFQLGMEETRGTLFWNIARILEERRPSVIILENVRNLAGPRHRHEWATIIRTLRDLGYRVSDEPAVFSPHLLPPELGGTPQVRERVFITGTQVGVERAWEETDVEPAVSNQVVDGWSTDSWDPDQHLLLPEGHPESVGYDLSQDETEIITAWDAFVQLMLEDRKGERLPGFPLWYDEWTASPNITQGMPSWKVDFLRKNSAFYRSHRDAIEAWKADFPIDHFPASRRKLEWQAQDAGTLWETIMHFRPSGIRAKRPTYFPALVAITQTSIVGSRRRRISPREAARLQGFPDEFHFGGQPDALTYRQLGNAVAVGAVRYVLLKHVYRDRPDVPSKIVREVDAWERDHLRKPMRHLRLA